MSNKTPTNLRRGQIVCYMWHEGGRDFSLTYGVVVHPSPKMPSILWERQDKPRRIKIHSLYETASIDWHDINRGFNKAALKRYNVNMQEPQ